MNPTTSKPWTLAVLGAAAVPFAAYVAFVCTDVALCGVGYGFWVAIFAAVLVPVPAAAAAALAAAALWLWPKKVDARRLRVALTVLALAAATAGVVYGSQGEHNSITCLVAL